MLQLMASIVGGTASNLKPLFDELKGDNRRDHARALAHLDMCLITQEHFFLGWEKALINIKNDKATHTREILRALKIQPLTATSAHLMGFVATPNTQVGNAEVGNAEQDAGDDDADAPDGSVMLSMTDLLTFGFTSDETDSLLQVLILYRCSSLLCSNQCLILPRHVRRSSGPTWL